MHIEFDHFIFIILLYFMIYTQHKHNAVWFIRLSNFIKTHHHITYNHASSKSLLKKNKNMYFRSNMYMEKIVLKIFQANDLLEIAYTETLYAIVLLYIKWWILSY